MVREEVVEPLFVIKAGSDGDDADDDDVEEDKEDFDQIELDFFLLTAICCKANLCEEYPDRSQLASEDTMLLFAAAQREHIEMRKFHLWIELQLRHKHDLPTMSGFSRFCARFNLGDEAKRVWTGLKAVVRHGFVADHELPELVRKFHKHRGSGCTAKRDEYLERIVDRSKECWQRIERRNGEYVAALQLEDDAARRVFGGLFVTMSKFLYYIRLLSLTLSAFEKDIEEMCGFLEFTKVWLFSGFVVVDAHVCSFGLELSLRFWCGE